MLSSAPPERAGMVSGLFGVYRQSGYALGFAITASLFTAIQNWFDVNWAYDSLSATTIESADTITQIYNQGSQWSPEVLVFILHIGILLCSSILIITFVNSIPKVKLMFSKQMTTAIMAVLVSIISMASYSLNAPGVIDRVQLNEINRPVVSVQAFGMASRNYEIKEQGDFAVMNVMNNEPFSNEKYESRCGFCHGADLNGIEGLGVTLKNSDFLKGMTTDEIVVFLKVGRMPNAEDSISGSVMPGFNWLEAAELEEIANFIKIDSE